MSVQEIELRDITKSFGGVIANDAIDLRVRRGEIHALLGENGAGKSTLMSILYGLVKPDSGQIMVRGEQVAFSSPQDAIAHGLGMVFQSFKLFPSLSVVENVIYGDEPTRFGLLDRREGMRRVAEISARYGLDVPLRARVSDLPVGVLQRVEIVKTLYRDAQTLILDEPTAVLTPQETDRLFEILRRLAEDGRTIILITHKLREVLSFCDRATVLRDGRVVGVVNTAAASAQQITHMMTGRDFEPVARNVHRPEPGGVVLECQGLVVHRDDGSVAVDDVSFRLHRGEVVGIAGVAGNGQTELAQALGGLRAVSAGTVAVAGSDVTHAAPVAHRAAGLAWIPEDRHEVGSAALGSTQENLVLGYHRAPPLERNGFLRPRALLTHAERLIRAFAIRVASPRTPVGVLSGGNLQKVIVARELTHGAPALLAEQPTRGVDIGAIEFIHRQLLDYSAAGKGVLVVSAELSELLALSDRILVMFGGRMVADLPSAEATEQRLGLLMTGMEKEIAS